MTAALALALIAAAQHRKPVPATQPLVLYDGGKRPLLLCQIDGAGNVTDCGLVGNAKLDDLAQRMVEQMKEAHWATDRLKRVRMAQ